MTKEKIDAIIKGQMVFWIISIFFATGYAVFAKLIWTAKFPILMFLPMLMIGFALGSINALRASLSQFAKTDRTGE